ncbi:uncharacterized protein LOC129808634 [Phlebotomus papatasi]|uniref:uncharacterized protein LOC129808634 n=1 Tax=Phlebotomus papatasi TaxID=29031 RepID=UPI0024835BAE|nr:uncharacterized protein LOC129808634 [Phlebotomus papatasi]
MVRHQRGGYMSAVSKVENDLNAAPPASLTTAENLENLQMQAGLVQSMKEKFITVQIQIISETTDPVQKALEQKSLPEFIQRCDILIKRIRDLIDKCPVEPQKMGAEGSSNSEMSNFLKNFMAKSQSYYQQQLDLLISTLSKSASSSNSTNSNIKLPQIDLPSFDGKFSDWVSFREEFQSSVINYPNLTEVQKLTYLRSALKGEAYSVIKRLQVTDTNFKVAWDLLLDKFERPSEIVADHIKSFYNMPHITPTNPQTIHKINSIFCESLMALDAMDVKGRDPWVIQFALDRLDSESKILWGRECKRELPTIEKFKAFLSQRCRDHLNSQSSSSKPSTSTRSQPHKSPISKKNATALTISSPSNCKCCDESPHPLYKCQRFHSMSVDERFETVKSLKLCRNCLASHQTSSCTFHKCNRCKGRHNILLHEKFVNSSNNGSPRDANDSSGSGNSKSPSDSNADSHPSPTTVAISSVPSDSCATQPPKVFLATAMVDILNANQERIQCRMVLDSGAQICVMTTSLYQKLKLPRLPANISVVGVGAQSSTIRYRVQATIVTRSDESFTFDCYVMPRITGNIPNWDVDDSFLELPHGKDLADPQWSVQRPVDLLLSGDPYWASWLNETVRFGPGLPQLKETVFGYVVVGEHRSIAPQCDAFSNLTVVSLDESLRKFWEIEDLPDELPITDLQKAAESHFVTTHKRNSEGRFVVQLPFKDNAPSLGSSRPQAIRQFLALERQFDRKPTMKALYKDVMDDYLAKGWLEPAPERPSDVSSSYYMPHHGVLKDSVSTKLRVVYNASAKTSSGVSLNDNLMIGPTVQPELASILLRFRLHPYALTADISKMYLQLVLDPTHTDFQRLVWRESKDQPIKDYRITRVCFGVASSPFLATRALIQLAQEHKDSHPLAALVLREAFYVDDCVVSTNSIETAKKIQIELVEVLKGAGFVLTKWMSNNQLLTPLHTSDSARDSVILQDTTTSVLGLTWDSKLDSFHFSAPISPSDVVHSKRDIASAIAKLFDPIGLVGPVIIEAKMLLQHLHSIKPKNPDKKSVKNSWDAPLPAEFLLRWKKFVEAFQEVRHISIPRWISTISNPTRVDLHIFCDASAKAYGAVIYYVSRDSCGNVCSRILMAKSRVAPLKEITIPRLELCGALLSAEMMHKVKPILNPTNVHYWTDSSIVLSWLNTPPDSYKLFVARRITHILKLSKAPQWRHVPTKDNPADVISRGCTPSQLASTILWWNGPPWLTEDESSWPTIFRPGSNVHDDVTCLAMVPDPAWHEVWMSRHSRLTTIKHVMAYILRFVNNTTPAKDKQFGSMSTEESETALHALIQLDQAYYFPNVKQHIAKGTLSRSQWRSLTALVPFVDKEGLIRVGGRLQNSGESFASKHPILLPKSLLTIHLMRFEHVQQLHAGPCLLLATIRQTYWPLSGRNLARKIVHECVTCAKANPKPEHQIMGNLPSPRVRFANAFISTGVDFAGPVMIRSCLIRSVYSRRQSNVKAYIAIFVCMATKAVHIEPVSALSTEKFLEAFHRFTSRRGTPRHMFSDRGRNFEGAVNELARLVNQENHQRVIHAGTESEGVIWHFNPPSAPHHGGLWEAAVKSVKYHLNRITRTSALTFEELGTVLCQIERVLNSRPLCKMSEDPNEANYLTPGHFLIGSALNAPPDPNLLEIPENRLSMWQRCQARAQDFARKWRMEYLNTLQQRSKWRCAQDNLKAGVVVLLLDETQKEGCKWILGKIVEVHPGQDGFVRVVSVRTEKGLYKRPITKIARLPIPSYQDDDAGPKQSDDSLTQPGEHVGAQRQN